MRINIVRRTLEALKGLEHLDKLDGTEDVRVLSGDLNNDLQVLADVDAKHFVQTSHRLLRRETAKVVDQPLENEPWSVQTYLFCEYIDVHRPGKQLCEQ